MNEPMLKTFPTYYLKWRAMRGQGIIMMDGGDGLNNVMHSQCTYRSDNWKAVEWTDVHGTWVDILLRPDTGGADWLLVKPSSADCGVRYLPWEPNTVTYRRVDNAAKYFLTGPLSGCNIYCGYDSNGNLYTYHANRNLTYQNDENSAPDEHLNAELKLGMMRTVLSRLTPGVKIKHQLTSRMYQGMAFVLGAKGLFGWNFYFHSCTDNGQRTVIEHSVKEF